MSSSLLQASTLSRRWWLTTLYGVKYSRRGLIQIASFEIDRAECKSRSHHRAVRDICIAGFIPSIGSTLLGGMGYSWLPLSPLPGVLPSTSSSSSKRTIKINTVRDPMYNIDDLVVVVVMLWCFFQLLLRFGFSSISTPGFIGVQIESYMTSMV